MQKNNTQTKRMTSIARKLHRSLIRKKISMYTGFDFLLFALLLVGWLASLEYHTFGKFILSYNRYFHIPSGSTHWFRDLVYIVSDQKEKILLKVPLADLIIVLCITTGILFLLQLLFICFSYAKESKKIRQILAPINEIALKADELSRMALSGDKYQQIEDAIYHLHPEEAELLSFGDSDLQGIEAAMNNLLLRMRDSQRQQARFVNDASHELRTPIAVIQGYANMLSRWGKNDEKVLDESITAIQNESDHMKHLVDQLLFLARGDSGKTQLSLEPVSPNDLMNEIYEESLMIDENHLYRFRPGDPVRHVQADPALLKQAVRILVDNSAKYTPKGAEILLRTGQTDDGKPYLEVQDSGIGMSPKDVSHMFERFYRSDEARSYQGTGLGLSIARWIIDRHNGRFEILSRTELGTRIRIILP